MATATDFQYLSDSAKEAKELETRINELAESVHLTSYNQSTCIVKKFKGDNEMIEIYPLKEEIKVNVLDTDKVYSVNADNIECQIRLGREESDLVTYSILYSPSD